MSTLMSTDINLSRPSTRVRASPGGATTICFGDETTTTTKPPMPPIPAASANPTPSPETAPVSSPAAAAPEGNVTASLKKIELLSVPSSSKLVGIALATHSYAEEMILEIAKSLAARGITNVVINLVESATILPYLVKQMTEKCDVVLAIGLLNSEERNLTDILTESLITTGMTQSCPVVPALISPASLLELKATLHLSCPKWASSVNSLVALETVAPIAFSSLEITEPIVPEEPTDSVLPKPPAPSVRRAQGGAVTLVLG